MYKQHLISDNRSGRGNNYLRVVAAANEIEPTMAAVPITARWTRAPPSIATGKKVRP
jgi:hypothetical protein